MAHQTVEGPYKVKPLETGGYELMELADDTLIQLRPRRLYTKDQRETAYRAVALLNRAWQQEQRENALLLALCREAGDSGPDAVLIDGARGNHQPGLIRDAANGDVAALVQLRHDFGLPIFI